MENKLAENIRSYRRNLGLTQEQLAERLRITLGTVSKWERGSSEPDLGYIMDLAELFHVSVDALIGFSMRGADADEEADRIEGLVNRVSYEELEAEYENALRKFPNHFRIVHGAASVFRRYGAMNRNDAYLKRAVDLYRHALGLISQNTDPDVDEMTVRNDIAGCCCELKDYRRAVEEFKKNNPGGLNNASIGLILIEYDKKPEEGIGYTERAFLGQITQMTTVMYGNIRYYLETGNTAMGLRAAKWAVDSMRMVKEDPDRRSFLDKLISVNDLILAVILDADGQTERAEETLREAVRLARAFDEAPIYSLENILFLEHLPKTFYVYDDAGPTAVEGLRTTLDEMGDLVSAAFRGKVEAMLG